MSTMSTTPKSPITVKREPTSDEVTTTVATAAAAAAGVGGVSSSGPTMGEFTSAAAAADMKSAVGDSTCTDESILEYMRLNPTCHGCLLEKYRNETKKKELMVFKSKKEQQRFEANQCTTCFYGPYSLSAHGYPIEVTDVSGKKFHVLPIYDSHHNVILSYSK